MNADITAIVDAALGIPGWTQREDAEALAQTALRLPGNPVMVEIGAFMGRCTAVLAGACRARGGGRVHCIDPFDGSGDAFSMPHYRKELARLGGASLQDAFHRHLAERGLSDWVEVHVGRAADLARRWRVPVDLLLLDGDQSPQGARSAYEAWLPYLRPGGAIVLRNTAERAYAEGHDGHRRLAMEEIRAPGFHAIRQVNATTFALRAPGAA